MSSNTIAERNARTRALNAEVAELAAEGSVPLIRMLVEDALASEDPDVRRKNLETLLKAAQTAEPKQPQISSVPLTFNIILDDSPQEPPRKNKPLEILEDVTPPAPPVAIEAPKETPAVKQKKTRGRPRNIDELMAVK